MYRTSLIKLLHLTPQKHFLAHTTQAATKPPTSLGRQGHQKVLAKELWHPLSSGMADELGSMTPLEPDLHQHDWALWWTSMRVRVIMWASQTVALISQLAALRRRHNGFRVSRRCVSWEVARKGIRYSIPGVRGKEEDVMIITSDQRPWRELSLLTEHR